MTAQGSQQHPTNPAPCAPSVAIETFNTLLYNQLEGGRTTMTEVPRACKNRIPRVLPDGVEGAGKPGLSGMIYNPKIVNRPPQNV